MTLEDMLADNYAHRFYEDPNAANELEDPDFDPDDVASQIGFGTTALPDDFETLST